MVDTVRIVGAWYYLLTAVLLSVAILWTVRRRVRRLGAIVLACGFLLNLVWEILLFTVWGRTYDSPLPPLVQLLFQSATEFGPLFLLLLLGAERFRWFSLDAWRDEPTPAWSGWTNWLAMVPLLVALLAAGVLSVAHWGWWNWPVRVYRHVDSSFFWSEGTVAAAALGVALWRADGRAIGWFFLVGGTNVLVELGGLVTGTRSYGSAGWPLAFVIGFGEGGAAAALTWIAATGTWAGIRRHTFGWGRQEQKQKK